MRHVPPISIYGNDTNLNCAYQAGTVCGAIRENVQNDSKTDAKHIRLSENRL